MNAKSVNLLTLHLKFYHATATRIFTDRVVVLFLIVYHSSKRGAADASE